VVTEYRALDANLRESFRILAQGRPRADIAELEGVSIASLGAAFQMFNAAFLNSPVPDRPVLTDRLACAQKLFAARELAWSFWICDEWLGRVARRSLVSACEDFGMRAVTEMPCMATDALREPKNLSASRLSPRTPPALEIRPAGTPCAMQDFRNIGATCFHVPPVWFSEVFDDRMPSRPFSCWVGYRSGIPVATAATVVSDGVIGLYNVATLPAERGRGYAEAITRHAIRLASAATGETRVVLQSTPSGERLYRRLGFREISRVVVFNSGGSGRMVR
jgi:ribosomal protein S18 acetylase RimI-like enzyme